MDAPDREEEALLSATLRLSAEQRGPYLDQVCAGKPDLRQRIEARLQAADQGHADDTTHTAPPGRSTILLRPLPAEEQPGTHIGRYKLLEKIGEGGCGVVYVAEQHEPVRRRVALKVIKLGMDTRQVVARFEAERQALALMDHPNIAKVLDAGSTETGRPYFVMALVKGIPINRYCDENKLETADRLRFFMQVCQAIQHAHQKGIIHRDIKPSNILVADHDGVGVPKVIDFGIAKATAGQTLTDKTLYTALEQFIGTPAYMSPEQAKLSGLDIDTRSDIYSLGVLLYELLTGRTPFDSRKLIEAGLDEIRRIIREEEPPRPSTKISTLDAVEQTTVAMRRHTEVPKLVHLVRGDLDWIVMKALEKDRSRRYETANGLAMDIQRHLNNEPVAARPPSKLYRLRKSFQRNKLAFIAGTAVLATLVLGLGFSSWMFIQERAARQRAVTAERDQHHLLLEEQQARLQAERHAYLSDVDLAEEALRESNFLRAQQLLRREIPTADHHDYRNWEWRYLWNAVRSDALATLGHQSARIFGVGFSSDGSVAGACDQAGDVKLYDIATRSCIATFHYDGSLFDMAFQPHGDLVAAAGSHSVALWNWRMHAPAGDLPLPRWARKVCFFPDGQRLAALCSDSKVYIWNLHTKMEMTNFATSFGNQASLTGGLAISPDGKTIAATGISGPISIRSASGTGPVRLVHFHGMITSLAFAPNTNQLLVSGWDDTLSVYRLDDLKCLTNFIAHKSWVCEAAYSPSGNLVVSGGGDQLIRLWSTRDWRQVAVLKGNHDELGAVAFSPDGHYIVSGAKDGDVKLWDAQAKLQKTHTIPLPPGPEPVPASPNGRYVVLWKHGQKIQILSAVTMTPVAEFSTQIANPSFIGVSPDGKLCACAADKNSSEVVVYQTATGRVITNLDCGGTGIRTAEFSDDGASLVTIQGGTNCEVWSTGSWTRRLRAAIPVPASNRIRLSSHAHWLAVFDDGHGKVWHLVAPPVSFPITGHREFAWDVAFSPDETVMASIGEDGYACIQRLGSRKYFLRFRTGLLAAHALAFSPDGSRLVTDNTDSSLRFWETGSYQQVLSIFPDVFTVENLWFVDNNTLLEHGYYEHSTSEPFFRKFYAPPVAKPASYAGR